MRATRVFRTIGRINSVLLLAIFAFGALALAWDFGDDLLRGLRRHRAPDAQGDVGGGEEERLEFQPLVAIEGTQVTVLPLGGVEEHGGSFSSESAGTWTRNLLFHDGATGGMRWLRKDDRAAIYSWEVLREGAPGMAAADVEEGGARGASGQGRVLGIRYEVADADTNGDGEITPADRNQVALSGADGGGLVTVLRDADELRGYSAPTQGKLFVFFQRQKKEWVAELDLAARRLVRETPLPAR